MGIVFILSLTFEEGFVLFKRTSEYLRLSLKDGCLIKRYGGASTIG